MNKFLLFIFCLSLFFLNANYKAKALSAGCNMLCVTNITLDTVGNNVLNITINNAGSNQLNYPKLLAVSDENGDTLVYNGQWGLFAQLAYTSEIYQISTSQSSLPSAIYNWTVVFEYSDANFNLISCNLPYPCDTTTTTIKNTQKSSSNPKILLYPNPAKENFTIQLNTAIAPNTQLQIFDALGKLIYSQKIEETVTTINSSKIKKGLYVLKIVSGKNESVMQKIIIE